MSEPTTEDLTQTRDTAIEKLKEQHLAEVEQRRKDAERLYNETLRMFADRIYSCSYLSLRMERFEEAVSTLVSLLKPWDVSHFSVTLDLSTLLTRRYGTRLFPVTRGKARVTLKDDEEGRP